MSHFGRVSRIAHVNDEQALLAGSNVGIVVVDGYSPAVTAGWIIKTNANGIGRIGDVNNHQATPVAADHVMTTADGSKVWYLMNLAMWWRHFIAREPLALEQGSA